MMNNLIERTKDMVERAFLANTIETYIDPIALDHLVRIAVSECEKEFSKQTAIVARLRELIEDVDAGHIEISGPEISGPFGDPPHSWQEEWLYLARQELAALK